MFRNSQVMSCFNNCAFAEINFKDCQRRQIRQKSLNFRREAIVIVKKKNGVIRKGRHVILSDMPRIVILLSHLVDTYWLRSLGSTSPTRLNRSAKRGQPYLRPHCMLKLGLGDPFTKIEILRKRHIT